MSNEKQETIADIVADIRAQNQGLPEDSYALSPLVCDLLSFAYRIETAYHREVTELRECLREAIDVACDGCKFSVWKNKKFVKCKRHKNWKCTFGTDRWRKALKGENND